MTWNADRFEAGFRVKPGAGRQCPAKSNRKACLTDSERTGVNGEVVGLGYYVAQQTLEREVVHEKFVISD